MEGGLLLGLYDKCNGKLSPFAIPHPLRYNKFIGILT